MSKKLPDCAWCGERLLLKGRGRLTVSFGGIQGSPVVGWHDKPCAKEDNRLLMDAACDRDAEPILRKIASRGKSRISAGSKFWFSMLETKVTE